MLILSIINILISTTVANNRNNSSYFKQKELQQKNPCGVGGNILHCWSANKLSPTPCDPMNCSTASLPCPLLSPGICANSCPLSPWCQTTISSSASPYSSCPQSFSAESFPVVLELQLQHQSFQWVFRVDFLQDWLVWSPCCPRDSQESSPLLSLLYGPTLTSVHDYWKNLSFDHMDLCWQSDVSGFLIWCLGWS